MDIREEEALDFKPFFDLVVGILFILLILVASQLFFSRWQDQVASDDAVRQRDAQRVAELANAQTFLTTLAGRLHEAGFSPAVDRLNMTLSIPTAEVLRSDRTVDGVRVSAFSSRLLSALRCVADDHNSSEGCPRQAPRIVRLEGQLRFANSGVQGELTPDQQTRLIALQLSAEFFSSAPDLLSLRSSEGLPILVPSFAVQTFAGSNTSPSTQDIFTLEFNFGDFDKSLP